jgi:hypothetical protein
MKLVLGLGAFSLLGCAGVFGGEDAAATDAADGGTDVADGDGDGGDPGSADDDGDGLTNDDEADLGTDPSEADSDGDGTDDGDEIAENTDPLDDADKPYEGGWGKDACRFDIEGEGYDKGQISENFTLPDQFGEDVSLHDFCDRSVLVIFSAFW